MNGKIIKMIKSVTMALAVVIVLFSCDSVSESIVTLDIQSTKPGAALPSPARSLSTGNVVATPVTITVIDKSGNPAGNLELTKAMIAVKEIEIEMEGQEDDESEYAGTFLVDLLNNTVTPEFPDITLPGGNYDEIELEIDKLDGTELDASGNPLVVEGDVMFGRSLYLEGTYTPSAGIPQTFALAYNTEEEISLKDSNSINSIAVTGLTELLIAFRMDNWFDFSNKETNIHDVDFSSLTLNGTIDLLADLQAGLPVIDSYLMEVIQENIEESADFGEDQDGDGILEEDEDDD